MEYIHSFSNKIVKNVSSSKINKKNHPINSMTNHETLKETKIRVKREIKTKDKKKNNRVREKYPIQNIFIYSHVEEIYEK